MAVKFKDNSNAGINHLYQPSERIQAIRKFVYYRFAQMKDSRAKYEKDWDRGERQYEAYRDERASDDWQTNIVPPFTTAIVERILAETVNQTLQPTVGARGPEDVPKAKLINYIKDYTWETGFGDLELYASLKQVLVKGKTIWQEDFWREVRPVKLMTSYNWEEKKEEYEEVDVTEHDDVYGETVPLEDFFNDEKGRTINRGRYRAKDCIRRYIMDIHTFRDLFKGQIWDEFGDCQYVRPGGDTNYWQFYHPPEGISKEDDVEVLFYWSRSVIPENGTVRDWLVCLANDVVFRASPIPFNHKQLPFAEGSDVPSLNQFYARGEPKLLESLQDELTTMRRMRIDRQHIDIWKMFLVSNRETLTDQDATVAPSKFLFVDDPRNSIVPLEYKDVNPSAYREEEYLKGDGRFVTGMESPAPSSSATEAAISKESTMKQITLKVWLWSHELATQISMLRVPNIQQFYQTPKVERIIGIKNSVRYKSMLDEAEKEGQLVYNNGLPYRKRPRTIKTEGTALEMTRQGDLLEKKIPGEHFFDVPPDMLIPSRGSFDLKLSGEPQLPISKPLRQQKAGEFMQHPIIMAAVNKGHYDVGKMADQLSETNDYDPESFKPEQGQSLGQTPDIDIGKMIEMANEENKLLMAGNRFPGTPYATREHTDVHLAHMESENFKTNASEEIIANFAYHVLWEQKAIEAREKAAMGTLTPRVAGQAPAGGPTSDMSEAQAVEESEAQAAQGARAVGPTKMAPGMSVV